MNNNTNLILIMILYWIKIHYNKEYFIIKMVPKDRNNIDDINEKYKKREITKTLSQKFVLI